MKLKKHKFIEFLGIFFIFFGVVIILRSFSGITGFVISEKLGISSLSFIGLLIIIIGFFIFEYAKVSLENLIYKGDRDWNIRDNEMLLSDKGYISVTMFEREIQKLKGDEELLKLVRDTYAKPLLSLAERDLSEKSELAKKCLKVLGIEYEDKDKEQEVLDKKQKREIKEAFKSYNGNLSSQQRKILKQYDLELKDSNTHYKIVSNSNKRKIPVSKTPSDSRAGLEIASDIISLIEESN
ncbi:MAG: hypothetical protein ACOC3Z_00110 [Nanoarchaeota archaeon]